MASKLYDWNVRNIAKNSHFSIFSKTVHTIRTKFCRAILHHIMILCVQFYQIRMTGIRASQKEKDLIRLLYRICGSGNYCFSSKSNVRLCVIQISKFHVHRNRLERDYDDKYSKQGIRLKCIHAVNVEKFLYHSGPSLIISERNTPIAITQPKSFSVATAL